MEPTQSPFNRSGNEFERAGPSLAELCDQFRQRLRLLVDLRIDRRIRARVDASDVVQEAFADAVRRSAEFQPDGNMSPYVWLRFLTLQQLQIAHRRHLGVKARSAKNERQLDLMRELSVESGSIASCLVGSESTPSSKYQRAEDVERLTLAVDQLDRLDREIVVLRHFEQLQHSEIGEILELSAAAVSSRYRRALKQLGKVIVDDDSLG